MPIAKPVARKKISLATMLSQIWDEPESMSSAEAKRILKYRLKDEQLQRMEELSSRVQQQKLNADDEEELRSYITMTDLIGILQSRARRRLKIAANFHAPV